MGIDLEPDQRSKLSTYATLLARWNEKINLVSRRSFENVVTDRLFDALLMWEENRPWSGTSHLDIGSGGGFPAVPIHIMSPEKRLVLVEPRYRRASFLSVVMTELQFDDVEIVQDRFEKACGGRRYDRVTAQAVASWSRLAPMLADALVQEGKYFWVSSKRITDPDREKVHLLLR